jgi:TP901 family phage tail tape measure protein
MLVLRGRNYLSNDLRKASADISGLSRRNALTSLASQKQALQLRQSQLVAQKKMAINEKASVDSGARRVSLLKAQAAQQVALARSEAYSIETQQKAAKLAKTVGANPQLVKAAQLRADAAAAGYANQAIAAQNLVEREARLTQISGQLTDKINNLTGAQQLAAAKMVEIDAATKSAGSRLGQYGKVAESVGRTMQTFGLVTTAVFAGAAYAAAKFNTQVALAATQSTLPGRNSVAQVQRNATYLQSQLQHQLVTGATPAKSSDLTGGLYSIFSGLSLKGGQKQQLNEGLGLLKEFSRVFTANYGQVSLNEVTKTGIALINNFGLSARQIPKVMNQMQASVRFGAMTMGEMTSSLNQVIPAFKSAGYSTKQMFEDIAFVSRVFPSLRIGTTGLARLTETFGKYHEAISQDVGMNIAPGGKLLSVSRIVQEIVKAHPELKKGGVDLQNYFKQVTGSSQFVNARRVFSAYVTQLGLYRDVSKKVAGDNNEVAKSFAVMSQTPQVRWAELTNQLHGLVLEIGTAALPVFQKFAKPIKDFVMWFDKLSPSTKRWVGEIGASVGIFLLVGGTLSTIFGMAVRAQEAIGLLIFGKGGLAALSSESGVISARFALGLGIPALILLLLTFHKQLKPVIDALGGLKNILLTLAAIKMIVWSSGIVNNFAAVEAGAATATTEVTLLSRALLLINGFAAVAVITIIYRRQIRDEVNKAGNWLSKNVPGGGFNPDHLERKIPGVAWLQDHSQGIMNVLTLGTVNQMKKARDAALLKQIGVEEKGITAFGNQVNAVSILTHGLRRVVTHAPYRSGVKAAPAPPAPFTNADVTAAVKNIVKLDDLAKRKPTIANFEAAAKALANLQSKASKDQFAAAQSLISALESADEKHTKKTISNAKKRADALKSELASIAQNAMSMYDTLLQQNQSIMGTLFNGPFMNSPREQNQIQYGYQPRGGDYLKDIRSQNAQFRNFYKEIGKLQKRGAPKELINQLIQAGPQALPAIRALAGMGKSQWKQYTAAFDQGQKLLHKQTISQLKDQLKDYRKYGAKIAEQMIAGMRDKRLGLANEIKSIIKDMFGVTVPEVHHPTTTAARAAARHAAAHAARHTAHNPHNTNTRPVVGTTTRTTQGVQYHTHYHVTAPTSEHTSVKAQLRHAEFARKTKYGVTP